MFSRRCILDGLAPIVLVAIAFPAFAQPADRLPPGVKLMLDRADNAVLAGDFEDAANAYGQLIEEARSNNDRATEAKVALKAAQARQAFSKDRGKYSPLVRTDLKEAENYFLRVIQVGNPQEKAVGQMHLANLYLDDRLPGNGQAACLDVLKEIDPEHVSPTDRPIYYYNLGRAYQLNERPEDALRNYRASLKEKRGFALVAQRIFELLRKANVPDVKTATETAAELLKNRQGRLAASELLDCLETEGWGYDGEAPKILAILVRYFNQAFIDPPTFEAMYAKRLQGIARATPVLKPWLDELHMAFLGDFEPAVEKAKIRYLFEYWTARDVEVQKRFMALLNSLGHYYYQYSPDKGGPRDPGKALARFAAVWAMDENNLEAALYTTSALRDIANRPDLDVKRYDAFINDVYWQKTKAYRRITENPKPNELERAFTFHVLLGSLFERTEYMNQRPEEWRPPTDVRSATFQWDRAVKVRSRIDNDHPSPALLEHLALAYARRGTRDTDHPELRHDAENWYEKAFQLCMERDEISRAGLTYLAGRSFGIDLDARFGRYLKNRMRQSLKHRELTLDTVGPLAFGADGILFASDPRQGVLFAFETNEPEIGPPMRVWFETLPKADFDRELAQCVGAAEAKVWVRSMALAPQGSSIWLSVSWVDRNAGYRRGVVRIDPEGGLSVVDLRELPFARAELPYSKTNRLPRRTITDLVFFGGHVLVSGVAPPVAPATRPTSSFRVLAFPSHAPLIDVPIAAYHGAEDTYSGQFPINCFVRRKIGGEMHLLAACKSDKGMILVTIPIVDLKPDGAVATKTVCQIKEYVTPRAMIAYEKGDRQFLLLSARLAESQELALLRIDTTMIGEMPPIRGRMDSSGGLEVGRPLDASGVLHMAKLGDAHAVLLREVEPGGGLELTTIELP